MQRLKCESKINIFETVKELRFQRMKMVQTMEQYNFLYACAFQLVKHKIPRAAKFPSNKKVSFPDEEEPVHIQNGLKSVIHFPITLANGSKGGGLENDYNINSIESVL